METNVRKTMTLCIIDQNGKVLLGLKKRGFGAGRWNGFGGKVKEGETIETAAARELQEEIGIIAHDSEKRALLHFLLENENTLLEVHVFRIGEFSGKPQESEEMLPRWFAYKDIPYDKMWADDRHWLPRLLGGEKLRGRFHFKDPDSMETSFMELIAVDVLE